METARATGDWQGVEADVIWRAAGALEVTTSSVLSPDRTWRAIDLVSAECVLGVSFIGDFLAGLRDFAGGRSETIESAVRDARKSCVDDLRKSALLLGANAVLGVSFAYLELTGGQKLGMIMVAASGTAVCWSDA